MILAITWRIAWAIATTAYTMIACHAAGHPGLKWRDGTRSCTCGRRWPT